MASLSFRSRCGIRLDCGTIVAVDEEGQALLQVVDWSAYEH
jgi:hypothetical protein